MGSLIAEIRQSESNTFLELLGHVGVTVQGIKSLRKLTPATLKQLAAIIEAGNVKSSTLLAAFHTFNLEIGNRRNIEELSRYGELDDSITPTELPKILSAFPRESRSFVVMNMTDLCPSTAFTVMLRRFLDDDDLARWSDEHLLGFRLKLCRADVAACLLPVCQEHFNVNEGVLWIASESIDYVDRSLSVGRSVIFQIESQKSKKPRLAARPSDGRDVRAGHYILFEITTN